jgi:hypothetical protein
MVRLAGPAPEKPAKRGERNSLNCHPAAARICGRHRFPGPRGRRECPSLQPISLDVLKEKYLKAGETSAEDLFRRVARALASVEEPADLRKNTKPCSWPTCTPAPSARAAS